MGAFSYCKQLADNPTQRPRNAVSQEALLPVRQACPGPGR